MAELKPTSIVLSTGYTDELTPEESKVVEAEAREERSKAFKEVVESAKQATEMIKPAPHLALVLLAEFLSKKSGKLILSGGAFEGMTKLGYVLKPAKKGVHANGTVQDPIGHEGQWVMFSVHGQQRFQRAGHGLALIDDARQILCRLEDYDFEHDVDGFKTLYRDGATS